MMQSSLAGRRAVQSCFRAIARSHNSRPYSVTSAVAQRTTTLGLLRETYNHWERRAPLTPKHVEELLEKKDKTNISSVLVQPSSQRIFTDHEYALAGASLQEDLTDADILLGVKQPRVSDLIANKSYVFFSHTIKGQAQNMALLQHCLDNNIQLMDYERMMQPHDLKRRLVSFGKFAGLAGAIDTLGALGRRLLYTHKVSTPLLNIPPAWMQPSLQEAKDCIRQVLEGQDVAESLKFHNGQPLVIAVTGKGGAVHSGVMELFQELPHQIVSVQELPHVYNRNCTETPPFLICPVSIADVFERTDGEPFDRHDFGEHAHQYRSLLAQRVGMFSHAIVNCAYWDARYPRLLSKSQLKKLFTDTNNEQQPDKTNLLLISDLSCDVHGSMECLEHTTTIEQPFFQYDPLLQRVTAEAITADGVTVLGVDILPSELPAEASDFFGSKVKGVVQELAAVRVQQPDDRGVDSDLLSPHLANAVISRRDGELEQNYRYLEGMLHRAPPMEDPVKDNVFSIEGHLFDSNLINHLLDTIEQNEGGFHLDECIFPRITGGTGSAEPVKSRVVLRVTAHDDATLKDIEEKMRALVSAIPKAEATMKRVDTPWTKAQGAASTPGSTSSSVEVEDMVREQHVLLLGAGRVAKSFVDYLGRAGNVKITVASDDEEEARKVAAYSVNGRHVGLNAATDQLKLAYLIEDSDLVVSLLPAPMHPPVAQECIFHKVNLVTASYESDEMRALEKRAVDANVIILNEVGLDPGLDHMSAMKIIDDIKSRGGSISRFSSVCGGLPAPEAADNPLKYKFSWSPLGVIRASQNPARFREDGSVVDISGLDLLRSARPFNEAWTDLGLECLPNRDSLRYGPIYGIDEASTIFRGTLRYGGFSSLLNVFKNIGLLDGIALYHDNWSEVLNVLMTQKNQNGGFKSMAHFVEVCADGDAEVAQRAMQALEWLGLLNEKNGPPVPPGTVVDAFCSLLQEKLEFGPGERDMVAMHHRIDAMFDGETEEHHFSELQVFGDAAGSAMAKTVGWTTAASAELVLEGALREERGLLLPMVPKVYEPILDKMAQAGIVFDESVSYHYPLKDQQA